MMGWKSFLQILPEITATPEKNVRLQYDEEADVLYIHFREPNLADDSELTEDDVIVRYQGEEVIGYTVLHAAARVAEQT